MMADDYTQRHKSRALSICSAAALIRRRVGTPSLEEAMIAQLGTISEMKGLWQALLERGLITEDQRQSYLDRGAQELLRQIESQAQQIYVEEAGNG